MRLRACAALAAAVLLAGCEGWFGGEEAARIPLQPAAGGGFEPVRILLRLCEDDFLSFADAAWEGVLKHGSYHEPKGLGVDESVMWGDYWFLDALDTVGATARTR